jgi:hypothetical protein
MISFKQLLSANAHNYPLTSPSVSVGCLSGHTLHLLIDKKEYILEASFDGPFDPWLCALCFMITNKHIHEAGELTLKDWESTLGSEQLFWDLWADREEMVWFRPLEMLRASIDKFQGKEHLYTESSPLICRCFGLMEEDIIPGIKSRAGMGCRTCLPQLERLLSEKESNVTHKRRYFKEISHADWLIIADEKLQSFSFKEEWGMEIGGFKGSGIVVEYKNKVSQKEEEEMASKLQAYLGGAVDSGLSFFLRRV